MLAAARSSKELHQVPGQVRHAAGAAAGWTTAGAQRSAPAFGRGRADVLAADAAADAAPGVRCLRLTQSAGTHRDTPSRRSSLGTAASAYKSHYSAALHPESRQGLHGQRQLLFRSCQAARPLQVDQALPVAVPSGSLLRWWLVDITVT